MKISRWVLVSVGLVLALAGGLWADAGQVEASNGEGPAFIVSYAGVEVAGQNGVDYLICCPSWYLDPEVKPEDYQFRGHDLPAAEYKRTARRARELGIKYCWSMAAGYDGHPGYIHEFALAHPEYWEKRKDGSVVNDYPTCQLSWGYPEVRAWKIARIVKWVEIVGFDAVLLDYTRYFGNKTGYSDIIVNDFKEKYGKDPFKLPEDDPTWTQHRADYVTAFVTDLRTALNKLDRKVELIGEVGPDPQESLRSVMLDWATWADRGLLDGVMCMIYERDTNNTVRSTLIANEAAAKAGIWHMPLLSSEDGNLTTPELLKEGCLKVLKTGVVGTGVYRNDYIEKYNLWPTIKEISHWSREYIDSQPLNNFLNSSFERGWEDWAIGYGKRVKLTDEKAHTGKQAAMVSLANEASIVQIVDRGFMPEKTTLGISAWFLAEKMPENASVIYTIRVHYNNDKEDVYRIPVTIKAGDDWQKLDGQIAIGNSSDLKFIIAGIEARAPLGPYQVDVGNFYIDDMSIYLADEKVAADRFKVGPSAEAKENTQNVNLVRGQCVTCSSFNTSYVSGDNVVDGDLSVAEHSKGSAWRSHRPAEDQWLKVYLPDTYLISRLRMLNNASIYLYRTKDYKVEVSLDDADYKEVARGTLPNDPDTWTEVDIAPVPAKYIKFTGIEGYHIPGMMGLMELEVY